MITSLKPEERDAFLRELPDRHLLALPYLFDFWALDHQRPPEGDWRTWVVLGGRGAGKTRAGSEWVRSLVEGPRPMDPGACARIALVSETLEQAREVMVFGESGIIACSPPDRTPKWNATRRMLIWPNGAVAQIFSAHDPERLRGPQFDAAWVDELAKWKNADQAWDMLQFGLRLGQTPRQCVTTTPKAVPVLRRILDAPSTVVTRASTFDNAANLAGSFLEEVTARYGGARIGRQELDGVLLEDVDGALWSSDMFEACRSSEEFEANRIVVAVDPAVTGNEGSDFCGIVVVGADTRGPPRSWSAVVLEDASVKAKTPLEWAEAALAAMERHKADKLVAEVNQGGDLVETMLRQVDPLVPYKGVRASKGKHLRAEPVAALYEQARIMHRPGLSALEDQMCAMTAQGYAGKGSPDRVDALVWALTDLMIDPAKKYRRPTLRRL